MSDNASVTVSPGWYPDPQNPSILRWWDGRQWTDQVQQAQAKTSVGGLFARGMEAAKGKVASTVQGVIAGQQDTTPPPVSADAPLYAFVSHIEGKNAKVEIYADRIEWEKPRGVSGGKIAAAVMTAGLSLAATGVKNGKAGTEMIPVKSISSVTTRRDGVLNSIVSIICAGNTIDFRCHHDEAAQAKTVLTQLVLGNHPSQATQTAATAPVVVQVQTPQASPPSPSIDPMEQLTKLKGLLDAGILTQEEFDAKKAQILAQL